MKTDCAKGSMWLHDLLQYHTMLIIFDNIVFHRPHFQLQSVILQPFENFSIKGVIMFTFKSKQIFLPLLLCLTGLVLSPVTAQAELGGSGSKAANQAAEQRAAREKREALKKQEAEAKQATETQQTQPAEAQQPAEGEPGAVTPAEGE
jgi:hypothetical protein